MFVATADVAKPKLKLVEPRQRTISLLVLFIQPPLPIETISPSNLIHERFDHEIPNGEVQHPLRSIFSGITRGFPAVTIPPTTSIPIRRLMVH